jgi:hypothetical protein
MKHMVGAPAVGYTKKLKVEEMKRYRGGSSGNFYFFIFLQFFWLKFFNFWKDLTC